MCSGGTEAFTFIHDIEKLKNGDFKLLGNLFAMALICGCAGPRCLMKPVVDKILSQEVESPSIDDVPDLEIQLKLKEVESTSCDADFQSCIESFPARFDAGVTQLNIKFDDKAKFIQNVCEHFCISRCIEEIQDVAKGMDILGLYGILVQNHNEVQREFLAGQKSVSADVLAVFTNINYSTNSTDGTNTSFDKLKEEDIFYNFTNFVEAIEQEDFRLPEKRQYRLMRK